MKRTPRFWAWYERHYAVNLGVTTALFALQVVHLFWLATHVIALRLFGESYFTTSPLVQAMIILVDYTEIPALISTTVLYLFDLRQRFRWKSIFFLVFLNSQWLHLFWITDAFVVDQFLGRGPKAVLPSWLAWVAILIDYLELPVMIDTFITFARTLRKGNVRSALDVLRQRT